MMYIVHVCVYMTRSVNYSSLGCEHPHITQAYRDIETESQCAVYYLETAVEG